MPEVPVKLPEALIDAADALIDRVKANVRLSGGGPVSRASVVRLALARGLLELAKECPEVKP